MNGETLRELAISEIHNKGHHSAERNLLYATEYLYWPEMRKDFREFVAQCELCQISKERSTIPTGDALMMPFPSEIFTSYAIDFMGPFTRLKVYDTVLVVVDRAVGYCWLIPTSTKATALETMELLRNYVFTPHGVPTSIVSDADPRFTSRFWKQTLKTMGVEHIMAAPGHHQTNGQAERKIRELKTALRTVINRRQTNWLVSLPELASYTNAGYSETINMSPYKAVYGRDYPMLSTFRTAATAVPASDEYYNRHQELRNSAYQALTLARFRSTRTATKRRTPRPPVEVGSKVLVFGKMFSTETGRSVKLDAHWRGPFEVLKYDEHTWNYTVKMYARMYRRTEAVFNSDVVKPYKEKHDEKFSGRANVRPAPIPINDESEWEVEAILDYRLRYGRGQFLVSWKGYPSSENSWEPIEGLRNAEDMIQEWWTDNMTGEEFPVFTGYITIGFSPTRAGFSEYEEKGPIDKGFWDPHFETDYDSSGSD
jgi:transposase InsO family protein